MGRPPTLPSPRPSACADLAAAVAADPAAQAMFDVLTKTNRFALIYRLGAVKRPATRERKIPRVRRDARPAGSCAAPAEGQAHGHVLRVADYPCQCTSLLAQAPGPGAATVTRFGAVAVLVSGGRRNTSSTSRGSGGRGGSDVGGGEAGDLAAAAGGDVVSGDRAEPSRCSDASIQQYVGLTGGVRPKERTRRPTSFRWPNARRSAAGWPPATPAGPSPVGWDGHPQRCRGS